LFKILDDYYPLLTPREKSLKKQPRGGGRVSVPLQERKGGMRGYLREREL
jgi:hypothetical protein